MVPVDKEITSDLRYGENDYFVDGELYCMIVRRRQAVLRYATDGLRRTIETATFHEDGAIIAVVSII